MEISHPFPAQAIFSELKSQCVALRPTFLDVSEDPPAETNDDRDRLRRQVRAILGAKNFEAATRAPEDVVTGAGKAREGGRLQRRAPLSVAFQSFRLIFRRAIISRNGLEA